MISFLLLKKFPQSEPSKISLHCSDKIHYTTIISPHLKVAVTELRAGTTVDGHADRLVAPLDVDDVLVVVRHVLLQLAAPDVAAEAEIIVQTSFSHLQGEEVCDVLHDGVGGRSLVEQEPSLLLAPEDEGDAGVLAGLEARVKSPAFPEGRLHLLAVGPVLVAGGRTLTPVPA